MEVRIFNPFSRKTGRISQFVTRMGSVTRRMHNKSFTVDNQAAILGGRNIGNEYFEADPVEFITDPYTGFWRRLGVGFMGILPIESQL